MTIPQIDALLGAILGAIALLGLVGSISVLFYRVKEIEKDIQGLDEQRVKDKGSVKLEIEKRDEKHERSMTEFRKNITGIREDVIYIRSKLDQMNNAK